MLGSSAGLYRAPLFIAWQLTNRCSARCLACCEDSGPDRGWSDELTRDEALGLARRFVAADIPYVAFGGGEPLGVSHFWDIVDILHAGGIALKIETDGRHIDEAAARRMAALRIQSVQISLDGATAKTHERLRPGGDFSLTLAAIRRLVAHGVRPEIVFAPTRLNLEEMVGAFELSAELGCSAFVTGPLMRLGRAALDWARLGPPREAWLAALERLKERRRQLESGPRLSIYPWDILDEIAQRLDSPQAMLLIVPNGKIKLLNALPFAPADLRRCSLDEAWQAYLDAWRSPRVRDFILACRSDPALLRHANETWA